MKNTINNIMSNNSIANSIISHGITQMGTKNKRLISRGLPAETFFVSEIPLDMIEVDSYQRECNHARVNKIVSSFNYSLVSIKSVNYRNGKFYIIDGNHTMNALKRMGYTTMLCKVFVGLTKEEEASLFAQQDKNVSRVNNYDKFMANIVAKDSSAYEINEVVKSMGLYINKSQAGKKPQCYTITSIRALEKMYSRYGANGVKFMLQVIVDAGWSQYDNGFVEFNLWIGREAYPICKENPAKYDKLMLALAQYEDPTDFANTVKVVYQQKTCANHNEGSVKAFVHSNII